MKIKFDFLYKNGFQETIEQVITEENAQDVESVINVIKKTMRDDVNGIITFDHGKTENGGHFIKTSEIVRVTTEIIEGDSN